MPDVFISYSRRDVEFVRELYAALAAHDKDIWADWEDIPITAEWLLEVYGGIESSDNFLFVITPDSLASDVCARELAHAVEKNKRLVPVLRREAAPGTTVPRALAARNWTFFRPDDDFAAAVDALVVALDTDLDWVRAHTRLLGRSLEWEKLDRDSSFLLRGRDLDDAEQWAAARSPDHEPQPTPLQLEYVLASRSSATRRQRITVTASRCSLWSSGTRRWSSRRWPSVRRASRSRASSRRSPRPHSTGIPSRASSSQPGRRRRPRPMRPATSSVGRCAALACAR